MREVVEFYLYIAACVGWVVGMGLQSFIDGLTYGVFWPVFGIKYLGIGIWILLENFWRLLV